MFCDVVFPEGNEKDFVELAGKLDVDALCLAYPYNGKKSVKDAKVRVAGMQKNGEIILKPVFLTSEKEIYKVHDLDELAVTDASGDSREIIARYRPDIVYNLELSGRKDFAKSRNGGLDKATCQFAEKNGVIAAFSFSAILNSGNLPVLLGRIRQNAMLCRKYGVKTAIASLSSDPLEMRSPHDLRAFLLSIGMHTSNAKSSIETVSGFLKQDGRIQRQNPCSGRKNHFTPSDRRVSYRNL